MTEMMNENMILAQRPDYKTEIAEILRSSLTPKRMQERLQDYHENDIAAALELLKKEERSRLYSICRRMLWPACWNTPDCRWNTWMS